MAGKGPQLFKKSPVILVGSNDPAVFLAALNGWLNNPASTYWDGSARTPDADSAWTSVIEEIAGTETCISMQPPATSTRKNQRVLIYGQADTSGHTPSYRQATKTNNKLYGAHVRGVPHGDETDYGTFTDATPYAGYTWTGFQTIRKDTSIVSFEVIEGKEAIAICMRYDLTNNPQAIYIAGDLWDGFGNAAIAEADGGRYGQITGPDIDIAFLARASSFGDAFMSYRNINDTPKVASYTPGGAVVDVGQRFPLLYSSTEGSGPLTDKNMQNGGYHDRHPFSYAVSPDWIGRLRSIYWTGTGITEVLTDDGTPSGLVWGFAQAAFALTASHRIVFSAVD